LQPEQAVEPLEHAKAARPILIVAGEAPHDEAVALFDPGLIVLAIGPPTREDDALPTTPLHQVLIDKLAAIVAVPARSGIGKRWRM
jgi:hypothetical protein